jgi:type II secretory pathway component PulK
MSRRGAALLMVLWLIVLLTGVVAVSLGGARTGSSAAHNRVALLRAGWAREGCLEILLGRARNAPPDAWQPERLRLDSVDLGTGAWCSLEVEDPGERLELNLASPEALLAVTHDSSLTAQIIRSRPWPAIEALPAWSPIPFLTVRGDGRINLNRAPVEVLAAVPGLGQEGAAALVSNRGRRGGYQQLEQVTAGLPPAVRQRVLAQYSAFQAAVSLEPVILIARVAGYARDRPVVARMVVTLAPAGSRLAVIRRETE